MRLLDHISGTAPISRVGFGCASLGSRIGRRDGLMALERAYEAGMTWYDVAPSYGDGMAESILGEFVGIRRSSVNLCTKVGLRAQAAGWKSFLRPVARMAVSSVPYLRKYASRSRTVVRIPIEADQIARSVESSLRQLRVDALDALLLHDPLTEDVDRPEILEALLDLQRSGKVRMLGVAGGLEAARRATSHPDVFSIIQFANNALQPHADQPWLEDWKTSGGLTITHSAFGNSGNLTVASRIISDDAEVRSMLAGAGYTGTPATMAANFLTDYALRTNKTGISLFSTMKTAHLTALLQRLDSRNDDLEGNLEAIGAALRARRSTA